MIALRQFTIIRSQPVQGKLIFNTFRHDTQPHTVGQLDSGFHNDLIGLIITEALNK